MPCPHYDLKIVGGGHKHSSAVSSSAYQSGEKLYSEREQVTRYYPKRSERMSSCIQIFRGLNLEEPAPVVAEMKNATFDLFVIKRGRYFCGAFRSHNN